MEEVPTPEEIECHEQIFDISFHPTAHVMAVGMVDGVVDIWKYGLGEGGNQKLRSTKLHQGSCRAAKFNASGDRLFTISNDRTFQAVDGNGVHVMVHQNAHDHPINKLQHVNENLLATGDDAGVVKLWDVRTPNGEIMDWQLHEDFVSGFCYHEDSHTLFSVSGDATMCVYDLKSRNNTSRSDDQESELHCVEVLKGGRKVVAGTQDGVILMFSWGKWGDCSDRYPGHPQTVDCMYKIDESTICTGSSDGMIRVVALQPNKIIGVIGDHEEFPVEGICSNKDKTLLGSFSHDQVIRFWDISIFMEDDGDEFDLDEDSGDVEISAGAGAGPVQSRPQKAAAAARVKGGEDDDAVWEDEDSSDCGEMAQDDESGDNSNDGDSDSSSEDEIIKHRKRLPTQAEKFFADL